MTYDKVIIIGTGKIACTCLKLLLQQISKDALGVVEYRASSLSLLGRETQKQMVSHYRTDKKEELTNWFLAIQVKTLVISANNLYIFPQTVCEKNNLTIMNYHSALLPDYAGMHTITWAIFEGETKGGITWHLVDSRIDHGRILIQRTCELGPDMTALDANRRYDMLATEAFEEILPKVLDGTMEGREQGKPRTRIFRSSEVPEGGVVRKERDSTFLYRFLRSMDYGAARLMPTPRIEWDGIQYPVTQYSFVKDKREGDPQWERNGSHISLTDNFGKLDLQIDITPSSVL